MPSERDELKVPGQRDGLNAEPKPAGTLPALLMTLPVLDEDFAPIADPPPDDVGL